MRREDSDVYPVCAVLGRCGTPSVPCVQAHTRAHPLWTDPSRSWLWSRWKGTILRKVLPREVLWNVVLVASVWITIRMLPEPVQMVANTKFGKAAASAVPAAMPSGLMRTLASVDKVWLLASGLVSFTISFFLSQVMRRREL